MYLVNTKSGNDPILTEWIYNPSQLMLKGTTDLAYKRRRRIIEKEEKFFAPLLCRKKSKTLIRALKFLSLLRFHIESQQVWAKNHYTNNNRTSIITVGAEGREAKQRIKKKDSTERTYRRYSWSSDLHQSYDHPVKFLSFCLIMLRCHSCFVDPITLMLQFVDLSCWLWCGK